MGGSITKSDVRFSHQASGDRLRELRFGFRISLPAPGSAKISEHYLENYLSLYAQRNP
jgi:hypothetical protein